MKVLKSSVATALGVFKDTVRNSVATGACTPPFLAVTATPAAPAVAAPASRAILSKEERTFRGSLLLGAKLLTIMQCADKMPLNARAARDGIIQPEIYGLWQTQVNTRAVAACGVPLGAYCIRLCRFQLVDQLNFE